MKLGITATQKGLTSVQWEALYNFMREKVIDEFHHGDCVGGDAQGWALAVVQGVRTVCHPPINTKSRAFTENNETREAKEYLDRNHDIVDETDELVACPKGFKEELRSGTWSTVRYAVKVGKKVTLIFPDGSRKEIKSKEDLVNL